VNLFSKYQEEALKSHGNLEENVKLLQEMPKNFCLNQQEIEEMSDKEYLKEFAKGPCSPTLILPGFLSTKLNVEIDCKELKEKNPRVFEQCGWNACSKHSYEVI
jgi:hypothetical protein